MSILSGKEAFPRRDEEEDLEGFDEDLEPVEVPKPVVNPLQALLMAARQRVADADEEKALKKRVAKSGVAADLAKLSALVEKREWEAVSWTAVVEQCVCLNCGTSHSHFVGWFTESRHKTDSTARRMQSGRRGSGLLHRTEVRTLDPSEHCGNCVTDWIKRRTALIVYKAA